MKLQKINDFYFYDQEQEEKNQIGFNVLALDDNNNLRRIEKFYYDEQENALFMFE